MKRLGGEEGLALVVTLLMLVLLSGLGLTALMMATMDASVSGYYRTERKGEAATDGALELIMAMIQNNDPAMQLPVGIDTSGTWPKTITYQDGDLDLDISINYKTEDSINYNTTEGYADEVVRYGQDYKYASAQKAIGKQPVYTILAREVIGSDGGTPVYGARAEADIISQLGFKTPAAIFADGTVDMMKNPYATEERIQVTSGPGTPVLATTRPSSDVFIQHAVSKPDDVPPQKSYQDQNANTHQFFIDGAYLFTDVFTDADITAALAAANFNNARNWQHCLLGIGDPVADLDVFATLAEAKQVFNFDQADAAVVQYDYDMAGETLEDMIGAAFADFRDLADQIIVGNENVMIADGSTVDQGKNLSGMTFGTAAAPQVVFFESNMNDDGTYIGGQRELTLVTTGGAVQGYGILIINGDANIQGSIDWTGLMIVRGNLVFRPWQGGTAAARSDATLKSDWSGWIMIGGNMELWTWYGGTIILGYTTTDAANIKGIIAASIPHKILSWRKVYD
jgi:hypothetical protein